MLESLDDTLQSMLVDPTNPEPVGGADADCAIFNMNNLSDLLR
jgi:hypothetical protein